MLFVLVKEGGKSYFAANPLWWKNEGVLQRPQNPYGGRIREALGGRMREFPWRQNDLVEE